MRNSWPKKDRLAGLLKVDPSQIKLGGRDFGALTFDTVDYDDVVRRRLDANEARLASAMKPERKIQILTHAVSGSPIVDDLFADAIREETV